MSEDTARWQVFTEDGWVDTDLPGEIDAAEARGRALGYAEEQRLREDVIAPLRAEIATAEARGYQNAIDILLAIPSHESHVCAELLEVRRDGGSDPDGLLRCDETRGEARGREQGRLRFTDDAAIGRAAQAEYEHDMTREESDDFEPIPWSDALHFVRLAYCRRATAGLLAAADFLESTGGQP